MTSTEDRSSAQKRIFRRPQTVPVENDVEAGKDVGTSQRLERLFKAFRPLRRKQELEKCEEDGEPSISEAEAGGGEDGDPAQPRRLRSLGSPHRFHWKYIPWLAFIGALIMFGGLVVFSVAAVQSGQTARELVDLVKGGASGFSWIVGAYKTTVTVTVAVSVVTIIMCMFIYGIRADQRLRQDLKYGEGERRRSSYRLTEGLATGLLIFIFILATWFMLLVALNVTATMAMVTLSQGAGAAMVILNTAVAVAQSSVAAAENALGMTYRPGTNSTLLGNSTAAIVVDGLASAAQAGQQFLDTAAEQNNSFGQAARGARDALGASMTARPQSSSPSGGDSAGLAPGLSSTLTAAAQQLMDAATATNSTMTRLEQSLVPTTQGLLSAALNGSLSQQIQGLVRLSPPGPGGRPGAPGPQVATDGLSGLRQSLTSLSGVLDTLWTPGPDQPAQLQPGRQPQPRPQPGRQPDQPQPNQEPQPQPQPQPEPRPQPQPQPQAGAQPQAQSGGLPQAPAAPQVMPADNRPGDGPIDTQAGRRLLQQGAPAAAAPGAVGPGRSASGSTLTAMLKSVSNQLTSTPGAANSTIGGLLNALMPTQENILQLAGAATHVVADLQRVAGAPEDRSGPFGFGNGTSVCPSLMCLDVKLYSFLNSAACICNAQQLAEVRHLGEVARDRFQTAIIGAILLYFGTSILLARLAAEVAMIARDHHLLFTNKFDRYHERNKARSAAKANAGDPATLPPQDLDIPEKERLIEAEREEKEPSAARLQRLESPAKIPLTSEKDGGPLMLEKTGSLEKGSTKGPADAHQCVLGEVAVTQSGVEKGASE